MKTVPILLIIVLLSHSVATAQEADERDQEQLPRQMHSAMTDLPRITVGRADADIVGTDNRALQAVVDYVANLGGGTVEIGPGEYLMRDSLHLRSHVTVRGTPGKTVLRKSDGASSALALDGDFGEEQITLADANGFEVGGGVAIWDTRSGGFGITVARLTGRRGNTFSIDHPLMADYLASRGARAAAVFPVVSGCDIEGARAQNLIVEGNREHNVPLDGCRGAGIYLYRGFGTVIVHCQVRNYNGDGISFQQSNDVTVSDCVSEHNANLGIHPGSGSQRPTVRRCVARDNGADGLYLCWRVKYGTFEDNVLDGNGRFGISIGHKDTDNLLRRNQVRGNHEAGVCFRDETLGTAAHRNELLENLIENNGAASNPIGVWVRGQTRDLVLKDNRIRDTRTVGPDHHDVGIRLDPTVGPVTIERNTIEARLPLDDQRQSADTVAPGSR